MHNSNTKYYKKGAAMEKDYLLNQFFDATRWTNAVQSGLNKDLDKSLLRQISTPEFRSELCNKLQNQKYVISPPHEALIPKDDGSFRTVYVNKGLDRIMLQIINDMLFELCPEYIHKQCKSYQKGIGCGKIVQQVSHEIQKINMPTIGVKIDLSKYFDSVPIQYIDIIFDKLESKFGSSCIIHLLRTYYHTDTVIDINKHTIKKYSSLRQGCAVAAFLADAVLFDIDNTISQLDVYYVRYSDDILILGNDWQKGYGILEKMLAEKQLKLNPKKVEILSKTKWFKFLGFSIKNDKISLSKARIQTFKKEIEKRTIHNKSRNMKQIINAVNQYLYIGSNGYSWATGVLPIINTDIDIEYLNAFVMDAIRASITNKTNIGGIGYNDLQSNHVICRGKGKNVTANKIKYPILTGYNTIKCMQNALMISKEVYNTLISN